MAGMTNFCPKIEMYFLRFDTLNWKSIRQKKVIWPMQILLGKKNYSFWTLKQINDHCATGGC
jgi:hypothetical protein